jgi:hypothetical protein
VRTAFDRDAAVGQDVNFFGAVRVVQAYIASDLEDKQRGAATAKGDLYRGRRVIWLLSLLVGAIGGVRDELASAGTGG